MCDCNDYSLMTANTGIASVSTADSSLSGASAVTVLTAGPNGGKLRSITIKAVQQSTAGMVRLFTILGNNTVLLDEIRIPPYPQLSSTPTPSPVLPMFVAYKVYNLDLGPLDLIGATTQNNETFNIIAEGLDISYPNPKPVVCCNFKEEYPVTGYVHVNTANPNLNGTGAIATVFTAPANYNGTVIESIQISALQSTQQGMVRLFIDDGGGFDLFNEITIPRSVQSSSQPSFKVTLPMNFNLQTGFVIGASTEYSQPFSVAVRGKAWLYA